MQENLYIRKRERKMEKKKMGKARNSTRRSDTRKEGDGTNLAIYS